MITRLLLILNISFIISPPFGLLEASLPSEGFAEPACRTLRRFEQSLKSTVAHKDGPLCMNSQPKGKHISTNLSCRVVSIVMAIYSFGFNILQFFS